MVEDKAESEEHQIFQHAVELIFKREDDKKLFNMKSGKIVLSLLCWPYSFAHNLPPLTHLQPLND